MAWRSRCHNLWKGLLPGPANFRHLKSALWGGHASSGMVPQVVDIHATVAAATGKVTQV